MLAEPGGGDRMDTERERDRIYNLLLRERDAAGRKLSDK